LGEHITRKSKCKILYTPLGERLTIISYIMVEETGVHRENHRAVISHSNALSHNVASSTPRLSGIRTHNFSGERH
jgi:hypothetical protein